MNIKNPQHVGCIMDGNGRWALARGKSRSEGHKEGVRVIKSLLSDCMEWEIPYLSLYAFSSENWKRPKWEVEFLFQLLSEYLERHVEELHAKDIRILHSGSTENLPKGLTKEIHKVMQRTEKNRTLTLNICLNYGGRQEILQMVQRMVREGIYPETETELENYLYPKLPDMDLMIRTGGEKRISNFLLWKLAYSELYFTDTLWPDFGTNEFKEAIEWYGARERRFGAVSA